MAITYDMRLTLEPKDEWGEAGAPGHVPDAATVGSDLYDMLADFTKHEQTLPYRVTTLAIDPEPGDDEGMRLTSREAAQVEQAIGDDIEETRP